MSEIELILTKLKIVSEEKENGMYLCDKEHSKILLNYIQQKENIIKEVREYIYKYSTQRKAFISLADRQFNGKPKFYGDVCDLLEILDKGE